MKISEQIEAWKKEGKKPIRVTLGDGSELYFSTPSRKQFRSIMAKARESGVAITESFVKNCLLGGDLTEHQIIDDNDSSYIAELGASIDDLLNTKKADVKKL